MIEPLVEIVILGAGGDGLVVAEAVRQATAAGRPIRLIGFLDAMRPAGCRASDADSPRLDRGCML